METNVQNGAQANAYNTTIKATITGLTAGLSSDADCRRYCAWGFGCGLLRHFRHEHDGEHPRSKSNGATVAGNNTLTLDAEIGQTSLANSAMPSAKAGLCRSPKPRQLIMRDLAAACPDRPGSNSDLQLTSRDAVKPSGSAGIPTRLSHYTFYAIFGIPISGTVRKTPVEIALTTTYRPQRRPGAICSACPLCWSMPTVPTAGPCPVRRGCKEYRCAGSWRE